jgi:hypothetical protein
MMNPPIPAPWTTSVATSLSIRAAFATLDRPAQRLLEAMLFDGQSCTRIAQAIGGSASDVRGRAGAAMLELHALRTAREVDRGGAVAVMLVLRALEALDPDEAELVDVMLDHQPALQRSYAEYRELVGELCLMVPQIAPSPCALARLRAEVGDDHAAN